MTHCYFDDVRDSAGTFSPRVTHEKRVHSSTYKTKGYSLGEGDDDYDVAKRHPSHSNERKG